MNFKIRVQEKIEKDIDNQLYRIYKNLYWIYPTRYKEYYQHFESFNFVKQMIKENQLTVMRTPNLTLIYNPYVRYKNIIQEYCQYNQDLLN